MPLSTASGLIAELIFRRYKNKKAVHNRTAFLLELVISVTFHLLFQ